jgi:hypothetical protein
VPGVRRWLAAGATLLVVVLQLHLLFEAGGLWRDEVNTLNTATSPSLAALWRGLEFESAPVLWPLLLRVWCGLGLGETDFGLRVFGMLGALSLPLAAWWVARRFGLAAPLFLLLLVALNPEVIRWSASLRPFGLGSALVLLVFEAIFRVSDAPTRRNVLWATLVTLLCVHALYYNAIFVLAICLGAALVSLVRRRFARLLLVAGIGGVSALSMLPYIPTLQAQYLGAEGFRVERLWWKFGGALAAQHMLLPRVWFVLVVMALVGGVALLRRGRAEQGQERDTALFAGVVGLSATLLFGAFLVNLGYATQAWYYVGFLALGALVLDLLLEPQLRGRQGAAFQLALTLLLVLVSLPAAWRDSGTRFTNVDVLAARVGSMVRAGDFVVVQPWFLAIPFERYYASEARWAQLPPIEDPRVHRWDLLAERIASPEPIRGVLEQADAVLRRGGRVFVVRLFPQLPRGAPPRHRPPAEDGVKSAALYDAAWSTQLDAFLRMRAARVVRAPMQDIGPVSVFESAWLQVAHGPVDRRDTNPALGAGSGT